MITLSAMFRDPFSGRIAAATTLFNENSPAHGANGGGTYQFQALDLTLNAAQKSAVATIVSLAGQLQAIKDGTANDSLTSTGETQTATQNSAAKQTAAPSLEHMASDTFGDAIALMPGGRVAYASAENHIFGSGGTDDITAADIIVLNIAGAGGADTINVAAHVAYSIYGDSVVGVDPEAVTADGNDIISIAADCVEFVGGGGGNDLINITAMWFAHSIDGGRGDDVINIAGEAAFVGGGKGDDTITFLDDSGAQLNFTKGDGHDTYNIGGKTRIDFQGGLSMKDVVTSAENKTISITFAESDDTITINYADAKLEGDEPKVTSETLAGHRHVIIS